MFSTFQVDLYGAKTTKQKTKTSTTTTKNRRLYHIYEAEITEEKKYILSENELIEAIKEYRLSQHAADDVHPCIADDDGDDNDEDDEDTDDEHHQFSHNSCASCCHCCSPSSPSTSTITTTTQTISSSFHHTAPIHPPPPTFSKNFIEIRERLRKKCFKKNESTNQTASDKNRNRSLSSSSSTTTTPTNPVSTLDIDTLVKYINGDTNEKAMVPSQPNAVTKKQKQKKKQVFGRPANHLIRKKNRRFSPI